MKKTVFVLLIFFSALPQCFSSERLRIAVLDLLPREGVTTSEAEVISEIIRTEIIKTASFEVIEKKQMDKLFKETGFQLTGLVPEEEIIRIGEILKADFIMTGSLAILDGAISLATRIVSGTDGKSYFGNDMLTDKENIFTDLRDYSLAVSNTSIELTEGATLANVERFIKAKDYEGARRRLSVFINRNGLSPDTYSLRATIDKGFARDLSKRARTALEYHNFSDAFQYLDDMLRLDPDNGEFEALRRKTQADYEGERKSSRKEMLNKCRALIRKKNYEAAVYLLSAYINLEGFTAKDTELTKLYDEIEAGYAKRYAGYARSLSAAGAYDKALEMMGKSLELDTRKQYVDLLAQVHARKNTSDDAVWQRINKKDFFEPGFRKDILVFAGPQIFLISDPFSQLHISGGYAAAEAGVHFQIPFMEPVLWSIPASLSFSRGSDVKTNPYNSIATDFFWLELHGGFGPVIALSYLDIGIFLEASFGLFNRSGSVTYMPTAESFETVNGTFGLGGSFYAAAYPLERLCVRIHYRYLRQFLFGDAPVNVHYFGLSAGVQF